VDGGAGLEHPGGVGDRLGPGQHASVPARGKKAFADLGRESLSTGFGIALLGGIFAGWPIAFLVGLLLFSEAFRVVVIVALTWLVGLGPLPHIVAGSVEVLYLTATGAASYVQVAASYMPPTLIGKILGGMALVAALNHAQVVSKRVGQVSRPVSGSRHPAHHAGDAIYGNGRAVGDALGGIERAQHHGDAALASE
jgi:hypothetical protein